jgi:hypothetical protein
VPNRSPTLDALIRSAEAAASEAAADEAIILARLNVAPERPRSAKRRPSRHSITAGRRQMKAAAAAPVMVVLAVGVAWLRA